MKDFLFKEKIKGKVKPPDDFIKKYGAEHAKEEFLSKIRKDFKDDTSENFVDRENIERDFNFVAGDQYDEETLRSRQARNAPSLVINRIASYISFCVSYRMSKKTSIKVHPDKDSDKNVARVREEIIRNIEKNSNANHAYEIAYRNQIICGEGNFYVDLEYVYDDVFDQDIVIKPVYDPMSVIWDCTSVEPTGKDADHVFLIEKMTVDEFKEYYPNAHMGSFNTETYTSVPSEYTNWYGKDSVQVASYYRMRSKKSILAMLNNGTTIDITDYENMDQEYLEKNIMVSPEGTPYIREKKTPYVEMYITNGTDLLEGPHIINIPRVPVFRCLGWNLRYADKKKTWGIVRGLRDAQCLYNYFRSTLAERLQTAPKPKWLAADSAVAGYEELYRNSSSTQDPLLIFNAESGMPPTQLPPTPIDQALVQEASMAAQDLEDLSGLNDASLGRKSNVISGEALRIQRNTSEVPLQLYNNNMNRSQEELGEVLNTLMVQVYDTPQKIKICGNDEGETENINRIIQSGGFNLADGRYNCTIVISDSHPTKRAESSDMMMNLVNAMPDTFSVAADKIVEAQDWPGAKEIALRLKQKMGYEIDESNLSEEERRSIQASRENSQKQAEMAEEERSIELGLKKAQSEHYIAMARQADSNIDKSRRDALVNIKKTELEEDKQNNDFILKTLELGEKKNDKR